MAFTNTSGERPHRYLINLRLDYARCLLTEGDMQIPGQIPGQIREIARLSRFSCQSHLATSLRKHLGVPPRKPRSER
ncbi:helix-turn-helix domain-containing protein [Nitratireductor aquimarinus]|uniref:helix-turn-helix domain-containing protein n=1 Tax=Nitratireductor aquimarinus TaxID=889300 RepID=UPI001A8F2339|nr:helix-turn-helix domain-containing protein [Nitratireductor aquimarinus]MBY6131332.1 helix-turn-helix domain-containing protein [Nitratireductor aquimarinus]MCA1300864.1 helix-turn-helix domain-containing protein [Nitratireductor aquimarinus]